jgi:hypothetical protein
MTDVQAGEAGVTETAHQERNYEAEASETGWRPEAEWSGKKENWKDARTWVENHDLPTRIRNEVKAEYEDRFARLEKMGRHAQNVIKQGYEAQIADLKAGRSEAIKKGDVKTVERYDEAIDKTKEAAKSDGESPLEETVNAAFKKRNPWYADDDDLTADAILISSAVSQAYTLKHDKPMPDDLMLEAVERKIKASADYKAKFGKPSANGHADVDGGSDDPGAAPKTGTFFAKLPPEARKQFAADVKAGTFKQSESEAWAKDYLS